jgi:hypothetical protein
VTLHSDLLAQAQHLASREPQRPRQASLRRAISAAYYALFHLLSHEASRLFAKDEQLSNRITRILAHSQMADVSKSFAADRWPTIFDPVKGKFRIPQELKEVAQAFVDLQQARHDADYDLTKRFTRSDVVGLVDRTKNAFEKWGTIRKHDLSRIYLASLILSNQWEKKR